MINGSMEQRIASNINIGFPHVDSRALLLSLNLIGICTSAGSACHSGTIEDSHVLTAIHADTKHYGSLRFSFGLKTRKDDIDYFLEYLPDILRQVKEK
jgi:cysteine desulfurase